MNKQSGSTLPLFRRDKRIRTNNIFVPNEALCQIELYPGVFFSVNIFTGSFDPVHDDIRLFPERFLRFRILFSVFLQPARQRIYHRSVVKKLIHNSRLTDYILSDVFPGCKRMSRHMTPIFPQFDRTIQRKIWKTQVCYHCRTGNAIMTV